MLALALSIYDTYPGKSRIFRTIEINQKCLSLLLNSFDVPCGPCQEDPDNSSYANHDDAYNQKRFPSLAHLTS